jgi:ABC-type dipeptide/oligopeptide/nickel transport system permease component
MLNFLIRRLTYMVIIVLFISFISFIIVELPQGTYLDVELERLRQQGGISRRTRSMRSSSAMASTIPFTCATGSGSRGLCGATLGNRLRSSCRWAS